MLLLAKLNLNVGDFEYKGAYGNGNYGDISRMESGDDIFEISILFLKVKYFHIGFVYRSLNNLVLGEGGYKRVSKYYYIPLGFRANIFDNGDLKINSDIDYDLFLEVNQYSNIEGGINKKTKCRIWLEVFINFENRIDNDKYYVISPFLNIGKFKILGLFLIIMSHIMKL